LDFNRVLRRNWNFLLIIPRRRIGTPGIFQEAYFPKDFPGFILKPFYWRIKGLVAFFKGGFLGLILPFLTFFKIGWPFLGLKQFQLGFTGIL